MNVWERLNKLAVGVNDWGKDVGLSAVAGPKFIWDIATAPWNDREEFNGFTNSLKQASTDLVKNIARPYGGVISAIVTTNRNILHEPYSAVSNFGDKGSLVEGIFNKEVREKNKEEWSKAWQNRNKVSMGQAMAKNQPQNALLLGISKITGNEDFLPQYLKSDFDIYDPKAREAAFKDSIYGRVTSGTQDATGQMLLDVSLGLGKAVKVARAKDNGLDALKGINEALAGKTNKYSKAAKDFADNDTVWATGHSVVRGSNDPATTAYLFGATKTQEEALYTWAAVLGEPGAVSKLDELMRPDIAEPIRIASGELTRYQLKQALRQERRLTASMTDEMLDLGVLRTPEEIAADTNFLKAYAFHDKYVSDLMDVATPGGATLTEGLGTGLSARISSQLATARTVPYHSLDEASATVTSYQPTPYHRAYYKFSWGQRERQAGLLNLNEGESIKEITAAANRLMANKTLSADDMAASITNYASATTPELKLKAAEALERKAFGAIGKKYGLTADEIERIFQHHNGLKHGYLKEGKEVGYVYDAVNDVNIKTAFFESQTANFYPLADFAYVEKVIAQNVGAFKAFRKVQGAANDGLETLSDLWKASVLLRLGYPVRNGLDSQLRILSAVGAMAVIKHLPAGTKHVTQNIVESGSRLVDKIGNIKGGVKPMTYAATKAELHEIGKAMASTKKEIAIIEARLAKDPTDAELIAELVAKRIILDDKSAVYTLNSASLSKLEEASKVPRKKTIGQGEVTIPSTYNTIDGFKYTINDGFAGIPGELFQHLNSSAKYMSRILDDTSNLYKDKVLKGSRGIITPDKSNYYTEWAATINTTFRNSAVITRLIKGENTADVIKWLNDKGEGTKLRQRLGLAQDEAEDYVLQAEGLLNAHMPKGTGIREKLAAGGVDEGFLRSAITDPAKLPTINGFQLDDALGNKSGKVIKRSINAAFKVLGTMPEDAWARHPLFIEFYYRSAAKRIALAEGIKKGRLTPDEFTEMQRSIEMGARKDALGEVKTVLYNVERRTNLAHVLRFISPFFSAQENALKTWFRLATDEPVIFSRAGMLWNAPNSMGLVTDQDGNVVPPYQSYDPSDTIWLQVPEGLKKIPWLGKGLASLDNVGISKRSLDVVFMGNPAGMSVGPYFGVSASYLIKFAPDTAAVLDWAFPYGPDTSFNQFLPTALRRRIEKNRGMDDASYARTFALVWQTERRKSEENNEPYLTEKQVKNRVDALYNVRVFASLVLPFAPQFDSPYRMYIDKYHSYIEKYGPLGAEIKFYDEYPEFFGFAMSLSQNRTGSAPTMTAVQNKQRYSDLITKIRDTNPALIGLITNGSANSKFNPTAYWWQGETSISPGSAEKLRGTQDPLEAVKRNEAKEGWIAFRKIQNYIDVSLRSRGLTSIRAKGAEDLAAFKTDVIAKLASKIDPATGKPTGEVSAWFEDYNDVNRSKILKTVEGLKTVLQDETFMEDNKDNPTWKSVVIYMQMREMLSRKLASRESANIDAKQNADIRLMYDAFVNKLKSDDIGFSDMYDRYLEQDPVYNKYLGVPNG